mmetsp:Transcript_38846/g.47044  ORF Transcript_38846/g.47044 Transcript_38846/m.47044 type:complete len:216 (+) Transcript_38846:141-788(+)|eukprot:CAMPEP_0197847300 /NCGR_PEP_ID=MMETSP1438-20131217/5695_1 /TAXON_ID=1461541 /ORGANISM="Pterosperma sp., Strain CCMP1384" /LENGTH=215 /DNA_ID=CAMNT_0043459175 /DNA_START=114 /DNA_END=761 /DNA_ORIENTATION=+
MDFRSISTWLTLVVLVCLFAPAESYKLKVLAATRECVQEHATEAGDLITGSFLATAGDGSQKRFFGGAERFDFTVIDPNHNTVYSAKRKAEHKFEVKAEQSGYYTMCFYNQGRVPAYVLYHAHVGHHISHDRAMKEHIEPLEESLTNLKEDLARLSEEYYYQKRREETHRLTMESSHDRVIIWSLGEAALLVGCAVFQVVYIRRLFDKKEMRVNV